MSVEAPVVRPRRFPRVWAAGERGVAWLSYLSQNPKALIALYVAISAAIVIPVVIGPGKAMSRIDEPTHADYAYEISYGRIPAAGSRIGPEIREFWACVGQERYELPACGEPSYSFQFPYNGENYNFSHPPLYYFATGVTARAIHAVVPAVGFVDAARSLGVIWLAAGMHMLFLALRRWQIDPTLAVVAPLLLPAFPRVMHACTTVNPDALAAWSGAFALWLAARYFVDGYRGWKLGLLVTALVGMTKLITVIPLLALAVLIVLKRLKNRRVDAIAWKDFALPIAIGVAVIVPYLLWQMFQTGRGLDNWENPLVGLNTRDVIGLPGSEWIESMFMGFNLASEYYLQPPLNAPIMLGWTRLLNVIVVGAVFAVIASLVHDPIRRSLGWLIAIGSIMYPIAVQAQAYLNTAVPQYFPVVTGRYGLALIPGAIACIVMTLSHSGYRRGVYMLVAAGLFVVGLDIVNGFIRLAIWT